MTGPEQVIISPISNPSPYRNIQPRQVEPNYGKFPEAKEKTIESQKLIGSAPEPRVSIQPQQMKQSAQEIPQPAIQAQAAATSSTQVTQQTQPTQTGQRVYIPETVKESDTEKYIEEKVGYKQGDQKRYFVAESQRDEFGGYYAKEVSKEEYDAFHGSELQRIGAKFGVVPDSSYMTPLERSSYGASTLSAQTLTLLGSYYLIKYVGKAANALADFKVKTIETKVPVKRDLIKVPGEKDIYVENVRSRITTEKFGKVQQIKSELGMETKPSVSTSYVNEQNLLAIKGNVGIRTTMTPKGDIKITKDVVQIGIGTDEKGSLSGTRYIKGTETIKGGVTVPTEKGTSAFETTYTKIGEENIAGYKSTSYGTLQKDYPIKGGEIKTGGGTTIYERTGSGIEKYIQSQKPPTQTQLNPPEVKTELLPPATEVKTINVPKTSPTTTELKLPSPSTESITTTTQVTNLKLENIAVYPSSTDQITGTFGKLSEQQKPEEKTISLSQYGQPGAPPVVTFAPPLLKEIPKTTPGDKTPTLPKQTTETITEPVVITPPATPPTMTTPPPPKAPPFIPAPMDISVKKPKRVPIRYIQSKPMSLPRSSRRATKEYLPDVISAGISKYNVGKASQPRITKKIESYSYGAVGTKEYKPFYIKPFLKVKK